MSDWKDPEIGAIRAMLGNMRAARGAESPSLAQRRAGMEGLNRFSPLPQDHQVEAVTFAGRHAERHLPAGGDPTRVILFLHGGGYGQGGPVSHRGLAGHLARAAGVAALVPDYRLAPEHPFPSAVEDAFTAYRTLLESGVASGRIVIAGDSSGGGLTLAAALAARTAGLPQPAGLFLISPWADLRQAGSSYVTKAATDPLTTAEAQNAAAATYLAGASPEDPLASPALADFTGLAPILIHVGSEEVLLSDALAVAERAGLASVSVTLEVWAEMIHVWHMFAGQLNAGRRAIAEAGSWIAARLA